MAQMKLATIKHNRYLTPPFRNKVLKKVYVATQKVGRQSIRLQWTLWDAVFRNGD